MLSIIYNERYYNEIWTKEDWPIFGVNHDVEC